MCVAESYRGTRAEFKSVELPEKRVLIAENLKARRCWYCSNVILYTNECKKKCPRCGNIINFV